MIFTVSGEKGGKPFTLTFQVEPDLIDRAGESRPGVSYVPPEPLPFDQWGNIDPLRDVTVFEAQVIAYGINEGPSYADTIERDVDFPVSFSVQWAVDDVPALLRALWRA